MLVVVTRSFRPVDSEQKASKGLKIDKNMVNLMLMMEMVLLMMEKLKKNKGRDDRWIRV